jgi:hypothetical protein
MSEQGSTQSSDERRPLWYGVAAGIVILSVAVGYRIVSGSEQVDFSGGVDGIQIKISQAEKAIESAQREMKAGQQQLNEREAALRKAEQELRARESKLQELLANLSPPATPTPSAGATPRLTPKQVRVELEKLQAAPVTSPTPPAMEVKPQLERLDELRGSLHRTGTELKAAARPKPAT